MSSSTSRVKHDIGVSVVVFSNPGLDFQKYRHVALYFDLENGKSVTIHIIGSPREFEPEIREEYIPELSVTHAGTRKVCNLANKMSKPELISFVLQTPIDNNSLEFSCQHWLGDTLERFHNAGHMSREDWIKGVDAMIDLTREAADEPSP